MALQAMRCLNIFKIRSIGQLQQDIIPAASLCTIGNILENTVPITHVLLGSIVMGTGMAVITMCGMMQHNK